MTRLWASGFLVLAVVFDNMSKNTLDGIGVAFITGTVKQEKACLAAKWKMPKGERYES